MSFLSDAAVQRLRGRSPWPEFLTGRYDVLEEIGRGGMGTVYAATDRELGRQVAIKVPHDAGSRTLEERLRVEARVLARLEHPGIVPIHDVGRLADGRLFYVMKRVHGRTLREHFSQLSDLTERLRVFERICEPVAFAHAHGCVHRDLKPENIMIGSFGEVLVLDWGIAQVADVDESGEERTVVGTQGFMSPEQAQAGSIDGRADVYSLGAILHLLLTGELPGPEPAGGALRRREIPRPLQSICARALAANPEARYPSASALADDVARFRAGSAVSAHRETVAERAMRLARTYRVAILLVLAYIVMRALVAFTVGR